MSGDRFADSTVDVIHQELGSFFLFVTHPMQKKKSSGLPYDCAGSAARVRRKFASVRPKTSAGPAEFSVFTDDKLVVLKKMIALPNR